MKKTIILSIALLGIVSMTMTACAQTVQDKWEETQDKVVDQVSSEMKKALISQVEDFLQSDDLQESLGFSEEQLTDVEASIEQYIQDYELDTETLTEVVGEIKSLFEEAQGLNKEEIQAKLDDILN